MARLRSSTPTRAVSSPDGEVRLTNQELSGQQNRYGVAVSYTASGYKRSVQILSNEYTNKWNRVTRVFNIVNPGPIDIEITMDNGTSRVVVTDSTGILNDTGVVSNSDLLAGHTYRVELEGMVDSVQGAVSQVSSGIPGNDFGDKHFVYDEQGLLVGEYIHSQEKEYVYLNGEAVAVLDSGTSVGSTLIYYIHPDHLGTPRLATDALGQEVWRWESSPFGVGEPPAIGSIELNLRFPGQYYDSGSGRHYNYFRDYDPSTGRYIESDPIGLRGGINTYVYVSARPLIWTDPNGLAAQVSTIECDGRGNLVIVNNDNNKCTRECTKVHEEQHRRDWIERYGSTLCKSKKKGYLPTHGPGYDEFLRESECKSWRAGFACLNEMKEKCECKDDPALEVDLNFTRLQIARFCYG